VDTGIILGTDVTSSTPVRISERSRLNSLHIIGVPGSGKTNLIQHIAQQDMAAGNGMCLLDPHGPSAETIVDSVPARRKQDVIYWRPRDVEHPFGFNPFECDPEDPEVALIRSIRAQSFVSALEGLEEFNEVFAQGTRMKDVLLNLGHAFTLNQGFTLMDTLSFLDIHKEGVDYRKQFYPALLNENRPVYNFWKQFDKLSEYQRRDAVEGSANKLRRFANDRVMQRIFGQNKTFIDFKRLISEDKILIVNLAGVGEKNAAFIGAFVVWELWQAAEWCGPADQNPDIKPFHIIADEFHRYMTTAFPTINTQGRQYKIGVTVAHQNLGQLAGNIKTRDSVMGVKNKVIFLVSGTDARELAEEMDTTPKEEVVMRERPKLAPVFDPYKHLAQHGHRNPEVQSAFAGVTNWINDWKKNFAELELIEPDMRRLIGYTDRSEQIYENMRSYLYRRMTRAAFDLEEEPEVFSIETVILYLKQYNRPNFDNSSDEKAIKREVQLLSSYDAVREALATYPEEKARIDSELQRVRSEFPFDLIEYSNEPITYKLFGFRLIQYVDYNQGVDSMFFHASTPRIIEHVQETGEKATDLRMRLNYDGILIVNGIISYGAPPYRRPGSADYTKVIGVQWTVPFKFLLNALEEEREELGRVVDGHAGLARREEYLRDLLPYLQMLDRHMGSLIRLGDLLAEKPILTPTGEYEYIPERQRLFSDVGQEIANALTHLPLYTARCTILEGTQMKEYTIKTDQPIVPTPQGRKRGEEIRKHSRETYGTALDEMVLELPQKQGDTIEPQRTGFVYKVEQQPEMAVREEPEPYTPAEEEDDDEQFRFRQPPKLPEEH
jgi:hypothetical protein